MTECRHGFQQDECGDCSGSAAQSIRAGGGGTTSGNSFALIYAPLLRSDTFLHLNRQADRWKIREYRSPHGSAVVLAQSAPSAASPITELASVRWLHEIAYPHSRTPEGVTVEDARYWFDAIERVNAQYSETIPALRRV